MLDITIEEFSIDVHKTYDLLISLAKKYGYTNQDLVKECGITKSTFYKYKKEKYIPSITMIDKLCHLLLGDGYYTLLSLHEIAKASISPDFGDYFRKLRLSNNLTYADIYKPLYDCHKQLNAFESGRAPMSIKLFYCYWRIFNDMMPFDILCKSINNREIIAPSRGMVSINSNILSAIKSISIDPNSIEYDIICTGMMLKNIRMARSITYDDIIRECAIYSNQITAIESSVNKISIDNYLRYIHTILETNLFQYIGLPELDTPKLNTALRQYRIDHNVTIDDIVKLGIHYSTIYRIEEYRVRISFQHVWYYIKAVEGKTIRTLLYEALQRDLLNSENIQNDIGKEDD